MITRSIDHQYSFEGKTYPGVTGILKVLDKSGPLMSWAARQTAEAFVETVRGDMDSSGRVWDMAPLEQLLKSVGAEGVVKAMTSRSAWKNDEAKDLGTEVHDLADRINSGRDLPPNLSPAARARAEHYAEWLLKSGWNVKISEAFILSPKGGYGGTIDILARDRDGKAVLADIKTGAKGVHRESVLQLAAYGMAELIQPVGAAKVFPMPAIDRYAIIHLTADGVREIDVPIGDFDRQAFYACMALTTWSNAHTGRL